MEIYNYKIKEDGCVSLGPPGGWHQDSNRCARDLLGETLVQEGGFESYCKSDSYERREGHWYRASLKLQNGSKKDSARLTASPPVKAALQKSPACCRPEPALVHLRAQSLTGSCPQEVLPLGEHNRRCTGAAVGVISQLQSPQWEIWLVCFHCHCIPAFVTHSSTLHAGSGSTSSVVSRASFPEGKIRDGN